MAIKISNFKGEFKMDLSFEKKVALVTGAASGMGLAAAKAFAQAGASVTLADINIESAQSAAKELQAVGYKVLAVRCDVTDERQVKEMVEKTVSSFGRLDAAFNNAGIMIPAVDTADTTKEEFDRVIAINLESVW